jgi:DNA-binding CsgD family transcriptional regulator
VTLRYEKGKPVGLDWTVCNDGQGDPSVWHTAILPSNEPKVRRELKQAGIGRGGATRLASAVEEQVIELYRDERKSAKEIASIIGIQPATVFKVLRRNKVPTRSKSEAMRISPRNIERMNNRAPDGSFI